MSASIILTGDINLMGVEDVTVPFRRVTDTLKKADCVFGNLECCLYDPPVPRVMMPDERSGYDGFFAPTATGPALVHGGFHCVGNANNQNYGTDAILSSNACLDKLGIPHVGTGVNRAAARASAVIERNGTRFGFLQRTSQYWPNHHEAGEMHPGVAVVKAYTAYQPVYYKDGTLPPNRPGTPPKILTWCDRQYLEWFKEDIRELRKKSDVVVSSHHMGHRGDILDFQQEIAHTAIDEADAIGRAEAVDEAAGGLQEAAHGTGPDVQLIDGHHDHAAIGWRLVRSEDRIERVGRLSLRGFDIDPHQLGGHDTTRLAVDAHGEIRRAQIGHWTAGAVGHGDIHGHNVNAGPECRVLGIRGRRLRLLSVEERRRRNAACNDETLAHR